MIPCDNTIIYTAAFIDGEGSIQINPSKGSSSGKKYWCLTVQVSSSCFEVLDSLHNEWKIGHITSWKPKGKEKYRRSYNWRVYSTQADELLKTIMPYMRIKQENAKIGIEFLKLKGCTKNSLTEDIIHLRQTLAMQMGILNERYGKGTKKYLSHIGVL